MTAESESTSHIVYPTDKRGNARVFDSYVEAFDWWKHIHHYKAPYLIAVLGRVIDPAGALVDPNE